MRYLLDLLYLIALVFYAPVLMWRMIVVGKGRHGWAERFGRIPRRQSQSPLIWVHAVSVGEANATATLVEQIRASLPDHEIAFSTTTDTGFARLAQLYPQAMRFRYPLDLSWVVARLFRRLRPSLILLVELEVWPNLTGQAQRAGVPVAVVNGRLSANSFKWYRRLGLLVRPMFARLTRVCAQEPAYADRFIELGTPGERVLVTGSVKYDTAEVADRVAGQDELAAAMGLAESQQLLVAGSTGPGEEQILMRVYDTLRPGHPALRLAIIPRKPERFDEVAALVARCGYKCWRRSGHADGETAPPLPANMVVVGDTMGELRKFYALSQLSFVGRSMVPMGGGDVMEAAALGRPVLVGPHVDNFAEPVARLASAGGLLVVQYGDGLRLAVDELLADPAQRQAMGSAARQAVLAAQGATQRTVQVIRKILNR